MMDSIIQNLLLSSKDVRDILAAAAPVTEDPKVYELAFPKEEAPYTPPPVHADIDPDQSGLSGLTEDLGAMTSGKRMEQRINDFLYDMLTQAYERGGEFAEAIKSTSRKAAAMITPYIEQLIHRIKKTLRQKGVGIPRGLLNPSLMSAKLVNDLRSTLRIRDDVKEPDDVVKQRQLYEEKMQRASKKEDYEALSPEELNSLFDITIDEITPVMTQSRVSDAVRYFLGRKKSEATDKYHKFNNKNVEELVKATLGDDPEEAAVDKLLEEYLTRFYGMIKNAVLMHPSDRSKAVDLGHEARSLRDKLKMIKKKDPARGPLEEDLAGIRAKMQGVLSTARPHTTETFADAVQHEFDINKQHITQSILSRSVGNLQDLLENSGAFNPKEIANYTDKIKNLPVKQISSEPMRDPRTSKIVTDIVDRVKEYIDSIVSEKKVYDALSNHKMDDFLKKIPYLSDKRRRELKDAAEGIKLKGALGVSKQVPAPLEEQSEKVQTAIKKFMEGVKKYTEDYNAKLQKGIGTPVKQLRIDFDALKNDLYYSAVSMYDLGEFLRTRFYVAKDEDLTRLTEPLNDLDLSPVSEGHPVNDLKMSNETRNVSSKDGEHHYLPYEQQEETVQDKVDDLFLEITRDSDQAFTQKDQALLTKLVLEKDFSRLQTYLESKSIKNPDFLSQIKKETVLIPSSRVNIGDIRTETKDTLDALETTTGRSLSPEVRNNIARAIHTKDYSKLRKILETSKVYSVDVIEELISKFRDVASYRRPAPLDHQPQEVQDVVSKVTDQFEAEVSDHAVMKRYDWIIEHPIASLAKHDVEQSKTEDEEQPLASFDAKTERLGLSRLLTSFNDFISSFKGFSSSKGTLGGIPNEQTLQQSIQKLKTYNVEEEKAPDTIEAERRIESLRGELEKSDLTPEEKASLIRVQPQTFNIQFLLDPSIEYKNLTDAQANESQKTILLLKNLGFMLQKNMKGTPGLDQAVDIYKNFMAQVAKAPQQILSPTQFIRYFDEYAQNYKERLELHLKVIFNNIASGKADLKPLYEEFMRNPGEFYNVLLRRPGVEDPSVGTTQTNFIPEVLKSGVQAALRDADKIKKNLDADISGFPAIRKYLYDHADFSKAPDEWLLSHENNLLLQRMFQESQRQGKLHNLAVRVHNEPGKYKSLLDSYRSLYDLFKNKNYDFKAMMTPTNLYPVYEFIDRWKEFKSGLLYNFKKQMFSSLWNSKAPFSRMTELEGQRIQPGAGGKWEFPELSTYLGDDPEDVLHLTREPMLLKLQEKLEDMVKEGGTPIGPRFEDIKDDIVKRVDAIDTWIAGKLDPRKSYDKNRRTLSKALFDLVSPTTRGKTVRKEDIGKIKIKCASYEDLMTLKSKLIDVAMRLAAAKVWRKQRYIPESYYRGERSKVGPDGKPTKEETLPFFDYPDDADKFVELLDFYGMQFAPSLLKSIGDQPEKIDPKQWEQALDKAAVGAMLTMGKNLKKDHLKDSRIEDEARRAKYLDAKINGKAFEGIADEAVKKGADPRIKYTLKDALTAKQRLAQIQPEYNALQLKEQGVLKQINDIAEFILNPEVMLERAVQQSDDPLLQELYEKTRLSDKERREYEDKAKAWKRHLSPLKDRRAYNAMLKKLIGGIKEKKRMTEAEYAAFRKQMHAHMMKSDTIFDEEVQKQVYVLALARRVAQDAIDQKDILEEKSRTTDPYVKIRKPNENAAFYKRLLDSLNRILSDRERIIADTEKYLGEGTLDEKELGFRGGELNKFRQDVEGIRQEVVRAEAQLAHINEKGDERYRKILEDIRPLLSANYVTSEDMDEVRSDMGPRHHQISETTDDKARSGLIKEYEAKKDEYLKDFSRRRYYIKARMEEIDARRKKIEDLDWLTEDQRKTLLANLSQADGNMKHNSDLINATERYMEGAVTDSIVDRAKEFLSRVEPEYLKRETMAGLTKRAIMESLRWTEWFLDRLSDLLSKKMEKGLRGEAVKSAQDVKERLEVILKRLRDLAPFAPEKLEQELQKQFEDPITSVITRARSHKMTRTRDPELIREFLTYNPEITPEQNTNMFIKRLESEKHDYETKKKDHDLKVSQGLKPYDPTPDYRNILFELKAMLHEVAAEIPLEINHLRTNKWMPATDRDRWLVATAGFEKGIVLMDKAIDPYIKEIGGVVKVASWYVSAEDAENLSRHDIIQKTVVGPEEKDLLPEAPQLHEMDILEAEMRDLRQHFKALGEWYKYIREENPQSVTSAAKGFVNKSMKRMMGKIQDIRKFENVEIPIGTAGKIKFKDIGEVFEDKLDSYLEHMAYLRSQIEMNQNLVRKARKELDDYDQFFYQVGDKDHFLALTEEEKKSIMDAYYGNLFWYLQKYWMKTIGKQFVLGENWMPPHEKVYDSFKNITDRVVKSDAKLQGQIAEVRKVLRAPFGVETYRSELKRLTDMKTDMEKMYKDVLGDVDYDKLSPEEKKKYDKKLEDLSKGVTEHVAPGTMPDVKRIQDYRIILGRIDYLKRQIGFRKGIVKNIGMMIEYPKRVAQLEAIKDSLSKGMEGREGVVDPGLIAEIDAKIEEFRAKADKQDASMMKQMQAALAGPNAKIFIEKMDEMRKDPALSKYIAMLDKKSLEEEEADKMPKEKMPEEIGIDEKKVEKTADYYRQHPDFNPAILYGKVMQKRMAEMLVEEMMHA